ncbi:MAG: UPF0175 family protein [Chloroflexi bacterium]|nr:UPF0175 family protein [Chloroflexota bacterium]
MVQVTLTVPDELAAALGGDRADQGDYLRLMAALKLFELGELSFRLAAELAGLSYNDFLAACATYHVPLYNYRPDELAEQLDRDSAALDKALGT